MTRVTALKSTRPRELLVESIGHISIYEKKWSGSVAGVVILWLQEAPLSLQIRINS